MSSSIVYGLWPGTPKRVELAEFRNAWGMAPLVWNAIAQRYFGAAPYSWFQYVDLMWPLAERDDLPQAMRAVLRMTFDTRFILAVDVRRAIDDIAIFLYSYRDVIDPTAVNHWPAYASVMVTTMEAVPAFGVHQTTVSRNPWDGPYDEATESYLPFDWSTAASVYEGMK